MYQLAVSFEVSAENHQAFIDAALANARDSLAKEPGTLRFELVRDLDDPNRFYLNEAYQDKAAFELHSRGAYFKKFFAIVDRFAKRPNRRDFGIAASRSTTIACSSAIAAFCTRSIERPVSRFSRSVPRDASIFARVSISLPSA
jgi:autoinducer 2-degrading protein